MPHATLFWSLWQALLQPFRQAFTRLGYRRFVEWVTGLALIVDEHTITGSVTAVNQPADWKALESFRSPSMAPGTPMSWPTPWQG